MSNVIPLQAGPAPDKLALLRELIAKKPDGVVEALAREAGVSTLEALEALPASTRGRVAPEQFEALWTEMTAWGEVLFIVHTTDIVLECSGSLPPGTFSHGYYNIHGDSAIGGHIRAENCRAIYFVDRPFHGRRSCSVQFFNGAGEAMFKVFVRRDKARELITEQVAAFEASRADFCQG